MLLALALLCGSCSGDHKPEDEHEHSEKNNYSAYSDDYEAFAVADPFVAGEPANIRLHVTNLKGFKPFAGGKVTVTLSVDGATETETLDSAKTPGIYDFTITPERVGAGVLTFDISGQRVEMPEVTVFDDEHEAHEAAEAAEVTSSNGVRFDKEQSWLVDFSTAPVRTAPLGQVIKGRGKVTPTRSGEYVVSAASAGMVSLSGSGVVVGKRVSRGEKLMAVKSDRLADGNVGVQIASAKAEYEAAKEDYELKSRLASDRLVTKSDLSAARVRYESAKALYSSLRNNFSGGVQTVVSPIDGYVTSVPVVNGGYVEAGQPLIGIASSNRVLIETLVPQRYYASLNDISGANFRDMISGKVFGLEELGGQLLTFSKSVDASSPLLNVCFEVENTGGFLPGSFVDTYIVTRGDTPVLSVPNESLIEEMGNYFVYVQLTPEYFEKREVEIGQSDGEYTQVMSGVSGNERVAAKGAVLLKLVQSAGKLDAHAGHVH